MSLQDVLDRCRKTAAWDGVPILRLDQRNDLDDTPLHTVCSWGELAPVEVLLANGADVKAQGNKGGSVLFNAIISKNPDVVALLMAKGADSTIKNDWGMTPLQYAVSVGASKSIVHHLQSAQSR